ncbi:MAG: murein endopeptidase, partial [Proteobacteria bacterium]|nr:murein endopeptidase [Pseudomonadota bacterium]
YIFVQLRLQQPLYEYAKKTGTSKAVLDHLFQFPRGRRNKRGIIRHERGHDDHFHVRFTAG